MYIKGCTTQSLKKTKEIQYMNTSGAYTIRFSLSERLASVCWSLVGGSDATYLESGIRRAIELAENNPRNSDGGEQLVA